MENPFDNWPDCDICTNTWPECGCPPVNEWREKWEPHINLLIEENKQLREAVEMSSAEIAERLYSGWYQAGVKQGGTLFEYEMDRRKLKEVENQLALFHESDLSETARKMLMKIIRGGE